MYRPPWNSSVNILYYAVCILLDTHTRRLRDKYKKRKKIQWTSERARARYHEMHIILAASQYIYIIYVYYTTNVSIVYRAFFSSIRSPQIPYKRLVYCVRIAYYTRGPTDSILLLLDRCDVYECHVHYRIKL